MLILVFLAQLLVLYPKNNAMNLLFIFLTIGFIFMMTFGGTILGKLVEDYRNLKKEEVRNIH